jgi:23S rRNA (uracil1939-C5)-methyltransferase
VVTIIRSKPLETLTVKISDLSRGGAGVAKSPEGAIIFVPFTVPGDEVEVQITQKKSSFWQGEVLRIVTPSESRLAPPCPVFQKCGGCTWQHIPYEMQFKTKQSGVLHALKRVQIELDSDRIFGYPAANPFEYRNRIQLRGLGDQLGYFAAKSHELIAIDKCWIARPEINASISDTREMGRKFEQQYKVEIEVTEKGEIQRHFNLPHAAAGFRQVNDDQNLALQNVVAKFLCEDTPVLFDLFGGFGNLSQNLTKRFSKIYCVDFNAPRAKSTPQIEFVSADAIRWASWFAKDLKKTGKIEVSSAIIDPPREGIGDQLGELDWALKTLRVKRLIAVGCEADHWARDLSRWQKNGWKLNQVAMVDLFPQTPHVEAVGELTLIE